MTNTNSHIMLTLLAFWIPCCESVDKQQYELYTMSGSKVPMTLRGKEKVSVVVNRYLVHSGLDPEQYIGSLVILNTTGTDKLEPSKRLRETKQFQFAIIIQDNPEVATVRRELHKIWNEPPPATIRNAEETMKWIQEKMEQYEFQGERIRIKKITNKPDAQVIENEGPFVYFSNDSRTYKDLEGKLVYLQKLVNDKDLFAKFELLIQQANAERQKIQNLRKTTVGHSIFSGLYYGLLTTAYTCACPPLSCVCGATTCTCCVTIYSPLSAINQCRTEDVSVDARKYHEWLSLHGSKAATSPAQIEMNKDIEPSLIGASTNIENDGF